MKRRKGTVLILSGILMLVAAVGLTVYNFSDDSRAENQSRQAFNFVVEAITQNAAENQASAQSPSALLPASAAGTVPEMPTVEKDGSPYIGVIEIPSQGISLPVLADWSYENLKIAPCRYAGSYYADDLVLCAHNYRSHFNPLRWVDMGEDVYFTTAAGETIHYVIANRETLQPSENEKLVTPSDEWDLTLFTCYVGGATRCVIRCLRAEN